MNSTKAKEPHTTGNRPHSLPLLGELLVNFGPNGGPIPPSSEDKASIQQGASKLPELLLSSQHHFRVCRLLNSSTVKDRLPAKGPPHSRRSGTLQCQVSKATEQPASLPFSCKEKKKSINIFKSRKKRAKREPKGSGSGARLEETWGRWEQRSSVGRGASGQGAPG